MWPWLYTKSKTRTTILKAAFVRGYVYIFLCTGFSGVLGRVPPRVRVPQSAPRRTIKLTLFYFTRSSPLRAPSSAGRTTVVSPLSLVRRASSCSQESYDGPGVAYRFRRSRALRATSRVYPMCICCACGVTCPSNLQTFQRGLYEVFVGFSSVKMLIPGIPTTASATHS